MPDITMCKGDGCELKNKCYRFKAKPESHWQSFFITPPIRNGNCPDFWPIEPTKKIKRK